MSFGKFQKCSHFGECGGCASQDVDYAGQLHIKSESLSELFAEFWTTPITVAPSPRLEYYRNKVDFSFAPKRYDEPPPPDFVRDTVLGFNRRGQWYWPLDIDDCRIGPEGNGALLASVREWYRSHDYHASDSRGHGGTLRILLVRDGKRTGERMVVVITAPGDFEAAPFVEAVQRAYPAQSIVHGISHRTARVAEADEVHLLDGVDYIEDELHIPDPEGERKLRFRISPFSFFQVNPAATEILYGKIREWVREVGPTVLYDLYGGSGGIAFSCSDLVNTVRSVENVESATSDGNANAALNGVDNVFFHTAKVKNYLLDLLGQGGMERDSAVVVDPSRSGMAPKALRRLLELSPQHLLYVSCKPEQLARELPDILTLYRITSLEAVDMFPHTRHVECIAALELK